METLYRKINGEFRPYKRADKKDLIFEIQPPPPKIKQNPLAVAQVWLQTRLVETPHGYRLDNIPASLDSIMQETNRLLKSYGADQVSYCDRWVV